MRALCGLTATTTAGRIDELSAASPKTRVVRRRFVDNGNGWTPRADGSLVNQDREGHSWIGTIAFTREPGGVMETMTVRRSE